MFISKQFRNHAPALTAIIFALAGASVHAQTSNAAPATAVPARPTYLHDVLPLFQTALNDRKEIRWRVWDAWKDKYYKQSMPAGNCPEMQTITENDRALIRNWVDTGAAYGVPHSEGIAHNKGELIQLGKRLFTSMCATCHQLAGQGVANKYPPLAGSDFLNAGKNEAIRVLLHGRQGEITVNGVTYNNTMPSFPLSDEDIANALTYTYNSFGNSGKEVTPDEVKALRAEKFVPTSFATNQPSQFE